MCGIIGWARCDRPVCSDCFLKGLHALAHRGPDDSGWQMIAASQPAPVSVLLGSRRLAILDLSQGGHQPMSDAATGNWIVFNGEIYNFQSVRRRLASEGVSFSNQSDTEVVLKAYGRWKADCLRYLRGMFAFAIWDAAEGMLFLARDRFGEKPLYYASAGGELVFASEVRALLQAGAVRRDISAAGLLQFASFGSVYDPLTLIEGVESLTAAHYMTWRNGHLQRVRYWDVDSPGADSEEVDLSGKTTEQVAAGLREIVDESVALRTVSDVPIGVFLSGGIDSSAIVALLSKHTAERVNTFSIVFPESLYSEASFSRLVARRFQTEHHEFTVTINEALESIPAAIQSMDQPTIDGVNTYIVSQQVRRSGLKVALSGIGGDELFAGYSTFHNVPRMERFAWNLGALPYPARRFLANVIRLSSSNRSAKVASLIAGNEAHPYFIARMFLTGSDRDLLVRGVDPAVSARADAPLREALRNALRFDPVNRVSYLEIRNYMVNTLLRDTDCMSMSHGLEVRAPFIDHKLASYLFAIPGGHKLSRHVPKHLLLQCIPGGLPQEVVHRPKMGFCLPFEHWLRNELRDDVERVLLRDDTLDQWLSPQGVARVWKRFLAGDLSWSRPWGIYVMKKWAATYLR